jgi:hypothetical protein
MGPGLLEVIIERLPEPRVRGGPSELRECFDELYLRVVQVVDLLHENVV